MDPFFLWLESTSLSVWTRESTSVFAFPAILSAHAIGMNDIGLITLGGNGENPIACLDPGIKAVDQHHSPCRWSSRSKQQRMIAASPKAANRSAGKPANAVDFNPLRGSRD